MSAAPRSVSHFSRILAAFRLGRRNRPFAGLVAAGLAAVLLSALPAAAREFSAIVIEASSGEVLYQDDPDGIRHPASLTKMMTLYLTFDALENGQIKLTDRLPVSEHAQSMSPTKLGLRSGQTLQVEHAILGLVTKSANDAAVVLAETLAGSESAFAQKMTQKARQLGMSRTVFRNASGLPDDDQVTTARDLATLALALQRNHGDYYPYFSTRVFRYGGHPLRNHNHLMESYQGMDGIKTGYVQASGFNLAASAVRDGRRLVGVVIGGSSAGSRDARMADLLDRGFADLRRRDGKEPLVAEEPAAPVRVAAEMAPAPSKRMQKASAKPPRKAEGDDSSSKGSWGVQLGAFSTKASGQKALTRAAKALPRDVAGDVIASVAKAKNKNTFHARFLGLNEKEARAVCSSLKRAGEDCIPVAPGA
jgi:D-alanyl-D-alanine carboxypeptidase